MTNTVRVYPDGQIAFSTMVGEVAPAGWWTRYPLLAVYMAAGFDENSAVAMVPEELMATDDEAGRAEDMLKSYGANLVSDIGYHNLLPDGEQDWLPNVIAGRYY